MVFNLLAKLYLFVFGSTQSAFNMRVITGTADILSNCTSVITDASFGALLTSLFCFFSHKINSFVVSNCEFVTFPLVSWVMCGA